MIAAMSISENISDKGGLLRSMGEMVLSTSITLALGTRLSAVTLVRYLLAGADALSSSDVHA